MICYYEALINLTLCFLQTSAYCYYHYSLVATSCLMYCVTGHARIADGTSSSMVSASLSSFIDFHQFLVVSVGSLLATLFLCVSVKSVLQLSSLQVGSCFCCQAQAFLSTLGAWLVIHHARSLAYLTVVVCPSLFSSYTGTVLMRSVNSTFSFPF